MYKLSAVDIGKYFLGPSYGGSHGSLDPLQTPSEMSRIITAIITGSLSIAGVILLFLLIGGGIGMIAGAGKSDPQAVEKGKKAATSALIGFIVVFSAYWIVKLVETITGLDLI
jgi:hypothetical protein